VAVNRPGAATWRMVTDASGPALLRLRLTAVPGWQATLDGRPLAVGSWSRGAMVEVEVPPGRHVVDLHYWPDLFTIGIVMAGVVVVTFAAAALVVGTRRRRGAPTRASDPGARPGPGPGAPVSAPAASG